MTGGHANKPPPLTSREVEPAAVAWVIDYERRRGRQPIYRRHDWAFPDDIESPPRVIEVKPLEDGISVPRLSGPPPDDRGPIKGPTLRGALCPAKAEP